MVGSRQTESGDIYNTVMVMTEPQMHDIICMLYYSRQLLCNYFLSGDAAYFSR